MKIELQKTMTYVIFYLDFIPYLKPEQTAFPTLHSEQKKSFIKFQLFENPTCFLCEK